MRGTFFRYVFFVFVSVFIFSAQTQKTYSQNHKENISCESVLPTAVDNFVHSQFPVEDMTYKLETYNDVICENPEDMANIVITVTVEEHKFYGIFHFHYNHNGSVPRVPSSFFDETLWVIPSTQNEWRASWCEIITTVYKEESFKHNCL